MTKRTNTITNTKRNNAAVREMCCMALALVALTIAVPYALQGVVDKTSPEHHYHTR